MNENDEPREPIIPKKKPERVEDGEPFDIPRGKTMRRDRSGDDGGSGRKQIIMTAIVAVVVVFVLNFFFFSPAKSSDVNKALDTIGADIRAVKDNDTKIRSDLTTLTNQVSGINSTNAASAQTITAQNTKIDQAVSQASGANSQLSALNSQLSAINNNVSKLQTDITALKSTPSVSPDLQKQLDANKATIAKLQTQIDDLSKKITTTSATTSGGNVGTTNSMGSSHTLQGVTATLTNLYGGFNGVPLLSFAVTNPTGGQIVSGGITLISGGSGYFPALSGNTSASGPQPCYIVQGLNQSAQVLVSATNGIITSFSGASAYNTSGIGYATDTSGATTYLRGLDNSGSNARVSITASALNAGVTQQSLTLQVTNNNNVVTNNVQLALGLAVVDSNGNPLSALPSWMTLGQNIAVTSGGFGASWVFQSTASPNIWIFSNMSTNNPFGLGALNLQPGQTQSFTLYVQVSNNSNQGYGTLYLYPIIRVVSFTG